MAKVYSRVSKINNVVGRSDYISNPDRQEFIKLTGKSRDLEWEEYAEFAKKIKATLPAVSNWETGRNIPNNKRLKAIADIGGMTVEELLYGDKESRKIQIGFRIRNIRQTNGLTSSIFVNSIVCMNTSCTSEIGLMIIKSNFPFRIILPNKSNAYMYS